ncbi:MAG TPA: lipoyl(octanoyl) transferase LipB [Gemmatimonadaceae bacterium]|jgi:lipoyl(octanoyl) transferase
MSNLLVVDLGVMPYADALALQRDVARARIAGDVQDDVLLLVEHPPVITLGRSSKSAHMLSTPEYLRQRGVELFEVERGGDVTFHGPGQLVGYPIIDLKQHRRDLHWYLRQVEQLLIDALAGFGLTCDRNPPYTGVWIENRKIASIGVHARDWVTWHGFALNVSTDLRYFDLIVPCGIQSVTMTSVNAELPRSQQSVGVVADAVLVAAGETFRLSPRRVAQQELIAQLQGQSAVSAERAGR